MKSRSALISFGISLVVGAATNVLVLTAAIFAVDYLGSATESGIGPHGVYGPYGQALLWCALSAIPVSIVAGLYFGTRCYRHFRRNKKTA
jgi:hypothetical protein